jgi:niacin transporter
MSFKLAALITAPIHGLLEVLVVLPFVDFNAYNLFVITGVGSMLHHGVDAAIAYAMIKILNRSKVMNLAKI